MFLGIAYRDFFFYGSTHDPHACQIFKKLQRETGFQGADFSQKAHFGPWRRTFRHSLPTCAFLRFTTRRQQSPHTCSKVHIRTRPVPPLGIRATLVMTLLLCATQSRLCRSGRSGVAPCDHVKHTAALVCAPPPSNPVRLKLTKGTIQQHTSGVFINVC